MFYKCAITVLIRYKCFKKCLFYKCVIVCYKCYRPLKVF